MKLNVICEQRDGEENPSTVIREKLEEAFAELFFPSHKNSQLYYGPQAAFGSAIKKNVLGFNGISDLQEMLLAYFADGVSFAEAYSKFSGLELFWQPSSGIPGNNGSSRFRFDGFVNATAIILRSVWEIATRVYAILENQHSRYDTEFYRNVVETLKGRSLLFQAIANETTGKYNLFRQITLENFTEDFNAPAQEIITAAYDESIAIGCSPKFHDMPVVLSFGKGSTGAFVYVTIAGETAIDSPIKVGAGNAEIGLMVSHKRIQGGMVAGLAGIPLRDIFDDLNRITTVVFSSTEPEDSEALAGISPKRIVADRTYHALNYLDFGPQRSSECEIEDYSNNIDSIVAYCRRNHRTKFTWWNGVKKDGTVFSSDPFEFKDTRSIFYLAEMVHDGRITINTTKGKLSAITQLGEIISDNGLTADYFVELFYDEEVDDFEKIKEVFKEKDK